jgi:hypothetical protein
VLVNFFFFKKKKKQSSKRAFLLLAYHMCIKEPDDPQWSNIP